jgi:transcriptional regulator with PAS, ATPase and Fis domain
MSESSSKPLARLKDRIEAICVEMIDRGILFSEAQEQFEKCFIGEVVRRNLGNLTNASAKLGIHRNTLAKRMNNYRAKQR